MDLKDGLEESLEDLSKKELRELLEKKQDLYDEVKEEMEFTLKNAGHHLPGNTRDNYERELQMIEQEIDKIQTALDKK
ncbi:hypothetical protein [Acetohalobium arabaticum]|uniref:Uncharacterized protein n=1 Tax=Acetohalobium arabaticum (strain ATCC 49924 / DSM 5501 / Z-7288) TaxID=574087 RepID=D9QV35_ACEAZ|nr:hypothetical protein [Acetohalobium arabaticum]ADL12094.1 conserved hypothetical protein [Acetohalobium arabaticum DSM 5501]